MPPPVRRSVRRRAPWWVWLTGGLVLAALVAWPLGAWQTVDRGAAGAQRLEPGQTFEGEQFTSSVERIEVLARRPGQSYDPEPGTVYLTLWARVENPYERTQLAPSDLFVVDGDAVGDDLGPASGVELGRDPGSGSPGLQPGLPEEVAYVWEVPEASLRAGPVRVRTVDRSVGESELGRGTVWLFPRVGAVVELDLDPEVAA